MQITAHRDFKRPRARVLAQFRNPAQMEAVLADLGAQVTRIAAPPAAEWSGSLDWRGAPRRFHLTAQEVVAHETMHLRIASDIASALVALDFHDLPDGGCRVTARADLTAQSLIARIALQSLRLVRGKTEDRLRRVLGALGRG